MKDAKYWLFMTTFLIIFLVIIFGVSRYMKMYEPAPEHTKQLLEIELRKAKSLEKISSYLEIYCPIKKEIQK